MRSLALFFAFYFAFLSCMTCTDEAPVCKDQAQTTIAASSHSDCGNDALGDWCSPLCQCHCCAGAVVPVLSGSTLAAALQREWATAQRHAHLVVATPTRGSEAVWQPPQA
jgi:hypothetical protein